MQIFSRWSCLMRLKSCFSIPAWKPASRTPAVVPGNLTSTAAPRPRMPTCRCSSGGSKAMNDAQMNFPMRLIAASLPISLERNVNTVPMSAAHDRHFLCTRVALGLPRFTAQNSHGAITPPGHEWNGAYNFFAFLARVSPLKAFRVEPSKLVATGPYTMQTPDADPPPVSAAKRDDPGS